MFGKFADKLKKMSFQNAIGMLKSFVSPSDIDEKIKEAFDKLDELKNNTGLKPMVMIGRSGQKFLIGIYTETEQGQAPSLIMGFHVGSAAELFTHIEKLKNGLSEFHAPEFVGNSGYISGDGDDCAAKERELGAAIG